MFVLNVKHDILQNERYHIVWKSVELVNIEQNENWITKTFEFTGTLHLLTIVLAVNLEPRVIV